MIHTRTLIGLEAHATSVECHVGQGLPSTTIVGLAEGAVKEARDRVRAALLNSGFTYPDGHLVINLAPGTLAKSSTALDLPIALAILAASKQIRTDQLGGIEFIGELGLFGELRQVHGALACALASRRFQRTLVVPEANSSEAAVAPAGTILLANNLLEVTAALNDPQAPLTLPVKSTTTPSMRPTPAFDQIIGQYAAKRAMIVAAAGGHHMLLVGPPGTGKTMLARAFAELLGNLSEQHSLEVAAVYSAAGLVRDNYHQTPFRDPHHSASTVALFGGGNPPTPGEIALAHRGVLFLDELPHFKPSVLNLLREPIETGEAVISRAKYKVRFPCRFQLIAAMNPCPAGRICDEQGCRCSASQVQRYQSRISGPLLDRIDIQVQVPALPEAVLVATSNQSQSEQQDQFIDRIQAARLRQQHRQQEPNASLASAALTTHMHNAKLDEDFLQQAIQRYRLSARSYHKIWRVARTIADLEGVEPIRLDHVTEALNYRALDWEAGV